MPLNTVPETHLVTISGVSPVPANGGHSVYPAWAANRLPSFVSSLGISTIPDAARNMATKDSWRNIVGTELPGGLARRM